MLFVSCVQDDEDLDLFGDETEEEKAAADEREAAKKAAAGAKKKESKCLLGLFLALSVVQCSSKFRFFPPAQIVNVQVMCEDY